MNWKLFVERVLAGLVVGTLFLLAQILLKHFGVL